MIVDEAHKMSAYRADKKTLAYQLGEALSQKTDHYLLMTATPDKGDPENFCLFLALQHAAESMWFGGLRCTFAQLSDRNRKFLLSEGQRCSGYEYFWS